MFTRKRRRIYTKKMCVAVTPEMWELITEMKIKLRRTKASILRDAITEYYARHIN